MVSLLVGNVLYLLPLPSLFLFTLVHSWLYITLLHILCKGFPLVVVMPWFLVPYFPWSLLEMRPPILSLCTLFLFLSFARTRFFSEISVCISYWVLFCICWPAFFFMVPFPLGSPVSCGSPVSVTVCHVLPNFPGLLSISHDFLAQEIHPSPRICFHIFRGCQ